MKGCLFFSLKARKTHLGGKGGDDERDLKDPEIKGITEGKRLALTLWDATLIDKGPNTRNIFNLQIVLVVDVKGAVMTRHLQMVHHNV